MQDYIAEQRKLAAAKRRLSKRLDKSIVEEYLDEATGLMIKVCVPQTTERKATKFKPLKSRAAEREQRGLQVGLTDAYELAVSFGVQQPEAPPQSIFDMTLSRPARRTRQTR